MSTALPESIDPWRAAKQRVSLAGDHPLAALPRLIEFGFIGLDEARRFDYRLDFGRDEHGQVCLEGWVRLRLCVICQRCLEELWLDVEAPVGLVLVRSQSAAELAQGPHEPLVVQESLNLIELIEDEIFLNLPAFPKHPEGLCQPPKARLADAPLPIEERPDHPFAVLAHLKGR